MNKFWRYILTKVLWFLFAFTVALIFNFLLIRLIPGNPVDVMMMRISQGGSATSEAQQKIYAAYIAEFGLDKPMWQQFFIYLGNLAHGDLGASFSQYPTPVGKLIGQALPWTLLLQLPAILIGWIIGNVLGVLTAYRKGWLDKIAFPVSLFISNMPFYCLSILFLYLFAVVLRILPAMGGYSFDQVPNLSWEFIGNAAQHYVLPFLSLVIIFIGGQAIGMRAMSIYELDADYVRYSSSLGVPQGRIVRYIFRNAMLPQVTGLALSIGGLVSGALITEIVFSYPGIGTLLFASIRQQDYPVVQGVTLIIMLAVLIANFLVEIAYGFIDPRIRATTTGEH
jgi:peptide/nickel transport system permease protein